MTVRARSLGFPRIGLHRELKKAQEGYWSGRTSREGLLQTGRELRLRHWSLQRDAGIDVIPANDFSFYDQMLDMACLVACVPARYRWEGDDVDLDTCFAMARGSTSAAAMEMTKWFDTNYHYLVPEFEEGQQFRLASSKPFDEIAEARDAGIATVPVLIGPVTFLLLGKAKFSGFSLTEALENLLPVYAQVLNRLATAATTVQIDEPCLVTDLDARARDCFVRAYDYLSRHVPAIDIQLTTYFGALGENRELAFGLPVGGLHVDLVRAPEQLDACIDSAAGTAKHLSLGLVDGRNVWRNDLRTSLTRLETAARRLGSDRVTIATSCSLLHVPIDLDDETALDSEVGGWLAFARQKLGELIVLKRGVDQGPRSIAHELKASDAVQSLRRSSPRVHDRRVDERMQAVTPDMLRRKSAFSGRRARQEAQIRLPPFPTTTIGSFPQTREIREARAAYRAGRTGASEYQAAMRREIEGVVRFQERIGLDVLVHGEAERNDMVEYFGEQLRGYVMSANGWVQSYGSRCVKPPILFGDVSRPQAMTVQWTHYAQSLTRRIVKGMLTGPVTILQWSFVRDDQPRSETCRQIALAIRDEVADLETAGIRVVQIDEPALREGLPLRRSERETYLQWAVDAFRLASSGVRDDTQIHTHMCYSEFNDIIHSVAAMDADVISIETSRSQMELLEAFVSYQYPNQIGPGIYDIHSPRVPSAEEMAHLLKKAGEVLAADQIWVNPDCGLKTRAWPEVESALTNMVAAARLARLGPAKG